MSIIESIKDFIIECPYLDDMASLNVDYLDDGKKSLSIEEVPTNTILESYLDGSSERQFVFVIAARLHYSDEIRNNIDNSGLFENVQNWLEECTENNQLPQLEEGLSPYAIEAMSNGYLFGLGGDLTSARYQIQCRLIYYKE